MKELKKFEITYRVGRKTLTWERFAASKELAIVGAIQALEAEYPTRKFVISTIQEAR